MPRLRSLRALRLFAFVAVGFTTVVFADLSQAVGENFLAPQESQMHSMVNQARSSNGMSGLEDNTGLKWIARRQAQAMASAGYIYHSSDLASQADQASLPWYTLGENVGKGGETNAVQQAFMNSPTHRANILHRDFNALGIGGMGGAENVLFFTQSFAGLQSQPQPAPAERQTAPPAPQPPGTEQLTAPPAAPPTAVPATEPPATSAPPEALGSEAEATPTVEPTAIPDEPTETQALPAEQGQRPERPSLIELLVAMLSRFVDRIAFWR